MKKVSLIMLIAIMLAGLVACAQPASGDILRSNKERVAEPVTSQDDLSKLVDGNSAFALALYQALREKEGNLFYSPYSISLALAMTYAGARGDTQKQMADTLRFLLSEDRLHTAFNALDQELARRGQGAKDKDGEGFKLNIANAIWGQKDYKFQTQFLDLLAENYGSGLRILDFVKSPELSRVTINNWVSNQTENRINDLIPQGVIDNMTRLVLTNAIYFNAAWKYPFDGNLTRPDTFHLLTGNTVTVPTMHEEESLRYSEGNGYQAVELAYDGDELSMVILLPEMGKFGQFENSLDYGKVTSIIGNLEQREVMLSLPKFKYESSASLKEVLSTMGMQTAFTDNADFSGMTGKRDLYIDEVLHKAFVSVDEAGTEAAAATAVVMKLTAMPTQPTEVKVDRPFIFLIRDTQTGTILFVGRVVNPA